jgi:peptide/nickel transport system permease protein
MEAVQARELKQKRASGSSGLGRAWRKFKPSMFGGAILIIFVAIAILAPFLGLESPTEHNVQARMQAPSSEHFFGTDHFGRDLFSRVLHGTRSSLVVAFASVAFATAIGVPFGLLAGYLGGGYDNIVMRFTDVLMAFPAILLGIGLIAALGPSLINLVIVLALVRLPTLARIVRADAMSAKEYEYVEAARALGASNFRVAIRHVFPNTIPSIIVVATLALGQAVILEAAFGFLGLGVQPPTPSWGNLLADGREFLRVAPYTSIFPGIFIALLALSFNLIGDGLRDFLDPRNASSRPI